MLCRIYKITSPLTDKLYVGSTTQTLELRLHWHEMRHREFQRGNYHYTSSFDILDFGDYEIQLLEELTGEVFDMYAAENKWMDFFKDKIVNRNRAPRFRQEERHLYYLANREKIIQQTRENAAKKRQRVRCACGTELFNTALKYHNNSRKHYRLMETSS